eukprot:TRINITY_DN3798_c0_g1_i1.p1 TRINITY_DN3798_c0_g1~~TRINITY_DN3798_c0_g1_i1.p1  ORF type:complete len:345 (+),score=133.99 TRINITY_DN3798_c0_g1_i1:61-1035(+)
MDIVKTFLLQADQKFSEIAPFGVRQGLQAIALFFIARFLLKTLCAFYVYFLRPGKNLKKYGAWAVVTGCTDGIGKGLAEQLARKGLNLVLISRTASKLQEQARDIEAKYKVKTKVVAVDFTSTSATLLEPVKQALKDVDVGILVNNVGVSYDHAEFFGELDQERIDAIVRVNVFGTTAMTQLVLPGMVERKRGAIVNVSSVSSLLNEPLYSVYSGTKAYVNNFSQGLYWEYKRYGIHVQASLPGFVATKLSKIRATSLFVPSANAWARAAAAHIGYEALSVPYWSHALQVWIAGLLPTSTVASFLLKNGMSIRRRAHQKKNKAN